VLELDGYAPPAWLEEAGVPGRTDDLAVRGRGLGAHVPVRVWSPVEGPARMLLANDGPEYDALSRLTHFCAVAIAREALPPFRVALLGPGDRDQWYSASAAYSRVLANDVIPALRDAFGIVGAPAGMGASLGGLAMLHAQRRFPRALGALFLQSSSFFMPRHDSHERGFPRYARIVRFVRDTRRNGHYAFPVPVTLTCGIAEENMGNNREMATALDAQGYEVSLVEVPDLHNYVGWRDAFDPHLTELLQKAWMR
jgi:enterochelin esterase-like enzyme